MNIGIMCHSSYGGSSRIALNSASELARLGHYVHLFTRIPPYLSLKTMKGMNCHTLYDVRDIAEHPAHLNTYWPGHELGRMARLIIKTSEDHGLDILHIHYAFPFMFIAREVKERLKEKLPLIILTLHGTDVLRFENNEAEAAELSEGLACCHALTTVSISHAELFARVSGREIQPEVIPNFVDLSSFSPKAPAISHSRPVILHISNFRAVKNPCGVVSIFEKLRKKVNCQMWFVGDGEEMQRVRTLVENSGLKDDVRFFGLLPDVSSIMNKADILVMSSVYESFCLTALEAMACGVPVLAPNVGGLPEVVVQGKTGFLYPVDDYTAAADFAVKLLSDPGLYKEMSMNAALRAKAFDQRQVVSLYEWLYLRVMAKTLPKGNGEC